jgi:hypothetical protein
MKEELSQTIYNVSMSLEEAVKQGSISVDDDVCFKYHVDVLKLFGKDFKAHMQATYKLDEYWRIWFPKLYKNRDFINKLLNGGETLEMNQLPDSLIISKKHFPEDEPGRRIVFAHVIDTNTNEKYYKFVGVFTELDGQMNHASCQLIATTLYFDGKGRFSIKPLVG